MRAGELRHAALQLRVLLVLLDEAGDVAQEGLHVGAAVLAELARDQIERLDVVRAFVDAEDLRVAAVLLDREVARVAHAAQHLDRRFADAERLVRRVRLAERRQKLDLSELVGRGRVVLAGQRVVPVHVHGGLRDQRADAFHARLHVEQHAAHVGVLDDRHARRVRILEVLDARALLALAGVFERVQVGGRRDAEALQRHADARVVHHLEHLAHAALLLGAAQLADAGVVVAELEHRRWTNR